jgi:hypothetical protein
VLREKIRFRRAHFRAIALATLVCAASGTPADAPVVPLTVCEVLRDLPGREGKPVAVLGRYSFRENGRWMGEQACEPATSGPPQLWLVEDSKDGPKPGDGYELDAAAVRRKLAEIERRTSLGKFRFGTPDYDRWAVVWGRVETRKPADGKASANLVYRGSGVVVFLWPEE